VKNAAETPSRPLDASAVERGLAARSASLGAPLSIVDVTTSTNDDARAAAERGAPHGATFIAERQTAGRGRGGREWYSPDRENVYLSIIARPGASTTISTFSLAVGIAVAESLERLLAPVQRRVAIKWPNDVFVDGRKIAGILIEGQVRGARTPFVVVGVGVNVNTASFPDAISASATSLRVLGRKEFDRNEIAAELIDAIGRALGLFEDAGLEPFLERLRDRDALRGQRVEIDAVRGIAVGIDREGGLLVRDDGGTTHRVVSGMVRSAERA
jgi:BirA family biotin operon repressor/biotin-[acetyl-CoA-carboxylase] ligase